MGARLNALHSRSYADATGTNRRSEEPPKADKEAITEAVTGSSD